MCLGFEFLTVIDIDVYKRSIILLEPSTSYVPVFWILIFMNFLIHKILILIVEIFCLKAPKISTQTYGAICEISFSLWFLIFSGAFHCFPLTDLFVGTKTVMKCISHKQPFTVFTVSLNVPFFHHRKTSDNLFDISCVIVFLKLTTPYHISNLVYSQGQQDPDSAISRHFIDFSENISTQKGPQEDGTNRFTGDGPNYL